MASADHSQFQFAAERYVLGELPEEEKLAFEEHYFSCSSCFQDVEDLTNFRMGVPIVLPLLDKSSSKSQSLSWFALPWLRPFVLSAVALLVLVTGYQNSVQIPRLKAASEDSIQVMAAPRPLIAQRGAGTVTIKGLPRTAVISIENEWTANYPRYQVHVTRHGSAESLMDAEGDVAQGDLLITIPARKLGAGTFDLAIFGKPLAGKAENVALCVFKVQGE